MCAGIVFNCLMHDACMCVGIFSMTITYLMKDEETYKNILTNTSTQVLILKSNLGYHVTYLSQLVRSSHEFVQETK